MSTNTVPQYPEGEEEIEYWLPPDEASPEPRTRKALYGVASVVMGAVLGIVVATLTDGNPAPAHISAGPTVAQAQQPARPALPAPAAAAAVPAPAVSTAVQATAAAPTHPVEAPAKLVPVALKVAAAHPAVAIHAVERIRHGFHRRVVRRRHAIRKAAAVALPLKAVVEAPAPVSEPAVTMIEGDVTLAGYDAAAGRIETREGMNFVLDPAVSERNAAMLEDSSGSLHYRCDQRGSCTLRHAGLAFSAARQTT